MTAVRIADVAKLAKVSTATVSHVINKTRFVSEPTRQRVLHAIDSIGYTPNVYARNLAAGSSQILGLIISDITNPFFPDLVKSIQEMALSLGHEVILFNTNYDPTRDLHYVQRLLELRVRGVLIMTSELDPSLVERLSSRKIPVVFLDIGKPGPTVSNIRLNYERGIQQAVDCLRSLGHRHIAFISGSNQFKSAQIRRRAFVRAMENRKDALRAQPIIYEGDFKFESGEQAVRELLRAHPRPTAIIASNDLMALGALRELSRAGLHVPHDVSLIGCDDVWITRLTDPELTTIAIPRALIGRTAVQLVLDTDPAKGRPGREVRIASELILRDSTGPAPL